MSHAPYPTHAPTSAINTLITMLCDHGVKVIRYHLGKIEVESVYTLDGVAHTEGHRVDPTPSAVLAYLGY